MNNAFQEKRNTYLLLVGLFLVLLVVLYFAFLSPLLGKLKEKQSSVETLQTDVAILEAKMDQLDDEQDEQTEAQAELQKKIPSSRKLDELVLMIQDIEQKSSSTVESIDFHYDVSLPEPIFIPELEVNENTQHVEKSDDDEEELPVIDFGEKPEKLKLFTIQMNISSPTYQDFLKFINAIEKQKRIMSVNSLRFDQPTDGEEGSEKFVHWIELTTFYYDESN